MFEVMKLCEAQLRDVNPSDVLNNGLYRRCNTYKGGGGYDQFPVIYEKRFGHVEGLNNQFVVQLKGCPLRCPYCYVTEEGVYKGESVILTSMTLVRDFYNSGCKVFHLMGGAPALQLSSWSELLSLLHGAIFHSDFLLLEGEYDIDLLRKIAEYKNALYAVSIKGFSSEEFENNTGTKLNLSVFESNMKKFAESGLNYYVTFTGMSKENIELFKHRYENILNFDDSFAIQLVHYKALDK